ncbi:MAG: MBL fold metallo-hydrolase [Synergistaceae bacterium]
MSILNKLNNLIFKKKKYPNNFVYYIGTGGSRFSMMKQARKTGGIWFSYGGTNGIIDPGPGCLYHICNVSPPLDLHSIDTIILTHKHIDHSTDINVIAEAMTNGGFEKRGTVILPDDCLNSEDPTLLHYSRRNIKEIITPVDRKFINLNNGVTIEPVELSHHGVQCYGYIFRKQGLKTWGIISDTHYLEYLGDRYSDCEFISMNITFTSKRDRMDHLSIEEVPEILKKIKSKLVVLVHLGIKALESKPDMLVKKICTTTTKVIIGKDDMYINLDTQTAYIQTINKIEIRGYKPIP